MLHDRIRDVILPRSRAKRTIIELGAGQRNTRLRVRRSHHLESVTSEKEPKVSSCISDTLIRQT